MATKNDVTGDSIVSRSTNKNYSDGWDRIFGKKNDPSEETIGEQYDPTSRTEDFIFPHPGTGQGTKVEILPGIKITENTTFDDIIKQSIEIDNDISLLKFDLTLEEQQTVEAWLMTEVYPEIIAKQKLDPRYLQWAPYMGKNGEEYPYGGAIGGGVTYAFTPTSIGTIIKVTCGGKTKDITDYASF